MFLDVAVMAQFSSRDINVGDENVADRSFFLFHSTLEEIYK